jgi:homoserine kinase type II
MTEVGGSGHALAASRVRQYPFAMDTVFDLWFTREYDHREDTELHIGIYASEPEALAAIAALREKPGFSDYPDGFDVIPTKLGATGWQDGFVTSIGPPPKDAAGEAFDLPAWL